MIDLPCHRSANLYDNTITSRCNQPFARVRRASAGFSTEAAKMTLTKNRQKQYV